MLFLFFKMFTCLCLVLLGLLYIGWGTPEVPLFIQLYSLLIKKKKNPVYKRISKGMHLVLHPKPGFELSLLKHLLRIY